MPARKHIKLSAGFSVDSSNYYERTENRTTGETKIIRQTQPVSGTANVTITNKPLKVEHSSSSGPSQTERTSTWTPKADKQTRVSAADAEQGAACDSTALFE